MRREREQVEGIGEQRVVEEEQKEEWNWVVG